MFVKAAVIDGAACRANAGLVQVRTTLLPRWFRTNGIGLGATAFVAVTDVKERPILRSSTRIVAPRPEPSRNSNEETDAGVTGSLAVTPGSLSAEGSTHKVVVAVSIL